MISLRKQQSPVKNQGRDPKCLVYSTVAAIEEAMIKAGKPRIFNDNFVSTEASKIHLEFRKGDSHAPGSVDKALEWATRGGYIKGYKWIPKTEIKAWLDRGYSVIISLVGYGLAGRDLYHNVLFVGYTEDSYEYKNSWGAAWGDEGYGFLKEEDLKFVSNSCYIVTPLGPNDEIEEKEDEKEEEKEDTKKKKKVLKKKNRKEIKGLTKQDIDRGLQKVLIAPIPKFNFWWGIFYRGGRVNWALNQRRLIYELYIEHLERIPVTQEVDGWMTTSSSINFIEKNILNSYEYKKKNNK